MPDSYALVGAPIDRSPSPAMHNAAFAALGIDAHYSLRPATHDDIDSVVEELRCGRWQGLNVTTPLKTALAPYADKLSDEAGRAGAVNTLWRDGETLHGALTDVDGIIEPLRARSFAGRVGLILGAGGAARAAAVAFDRLGLEVHVAARRLDAATELLDAIMPARPCGALALDDSEGLEALFPRLQLVLQATPVGREGGRHALPWQQTAAGLVAFEMLYVPRRTAFLDEAAACGCDCIEGSEMLLHQGARSFNLWTGQAAPIETMRVALQTAL